MRMCRFLSVQMLERRSTPICQYATFLVPNPELQWGSAYGVEDVNLHLLLYCCAIQKCFSILAALVLPSVRECQKSFKFHRDMLGFLTMAGIVTTCSTLVVVRSHPSIHMHA